MRTLSLALCATFLAIASTSAHADPLKNTTITQTLTFSSGPGLNSNGFTTATVVNGQGFTGTSGAQSESGMGKTWNTTNTYTAEFMNATVPRPYDELKVDDLCTAQTSTGNGPCNHDPYYAFTMTFTDTAFEGLEEITLNNPANYSVTLTGNTLTIKSVLGTVPTSGQSLLIEFEPLPASAPEPNSLLLLGTGLVAMVGLMRRRLAA